MVNLMALVVLAALSQPHATRIGDPPPGDRIERQHQPFAARPLTPRQKAWFAHAIDDILNGK
ncbi:protein of unknown function [Beijerinckiaceae bacterium RH AL1]|nr:protein of unknown function [Beijerinckiaceae bacterium RH CH11]VVB45673.1 protein of unknown function [Beijerinckiaceae bacterium RH AL8]VVC54945.1 protein of unknown function [Beijerinckiaceae bacterium RH AL1]